jgi:hypothetical protein
VWKAARVPFLVASSLEGASMSWIEILPLVLFSWLVTAVAVGVVVGSAINLGTEEPG